MVVLDDLRALRQAPETVNMCSGVLTTATLKNMLLW
jgi:hypothetical protein